MKKLFGVSALALVLALGAITAFATDITVEQPYEAACEKYSVGAIIWNGEAWEMTVTVNDETFVWLFDGGTVSADGEIVDWYEVSQNVAGELGFKLVPNVPFDSQPTSAPAAVTPLPSHAPNVTPPPVAGVDLSQTVWLSATGTRYHSINNCGNMNPARASSMTRGEARDAGFQACARCW